MKKTLLLLAGPRRAASEASGQDTLKTTNIQRYYTPVRLFLLGAAEVMPDGQVRIQDRAGADGLRPVDQPRHRAQLRGLLDAAGRAEPDAEGEDRSTQGQGRHQARAAESFDYCDAAFAALDDQKILASPQMTYAFLHTTVHNNEIYGNIVGYLRANRITPPSTEMVQEMIKAKKTPEQMFKEMMERYNKKPPAE